MILILTSLENLSRTKRNWYLIYIEHTCVLIVNVMYFSPLFNKVCSFTEETRSFVNEFSPILLTQLFNIKMISQKE